MKKIFLTLGTTIVTTAPLATVIACGKSETSTETPLKTPVETPSETPVETPVEETPSEIPVETPSMETISFVLDETTLEISNLNLDWNYNEIKDANDTIAALIDDPDSVTEEEKLTFINLNNELNSKLDEFYTLINKEEYYDVTKIILKGFVDDREIYILLDMSKIIDDEGELITPNGTLKHVIDLPWTSFDIGEELLGKNQVIQSANTQKMITILDTFPNNYGSDSYKEIRQELKDLSLESTLLDISEVTDKIVVKTATEAKTKLGLSINDFEKITNVFSDKNFNFLEITVKKHYEQNEIKITFDEDKNLLNNQSVYVIIK